MSSLRRKKEGAYLEILTSVREILFSEDPSLTDSGRLAAMRNLFKDSQVTFKLIENQVPNPDENVQPDTEPEIELPDPTESEDKLDNIYREEIERLRAENEALRTSVINKPQKEEIFPPAYIPHDSPV